ncbi:MAG: zinc ABC transporter substrate-binding protein [Candidatus Zixiibacteriota bacterium]
MNRKLLLSIFYLAIIVISLARPQAQATVMPVDSLRIFVSILPQKYFAEQIFPQPVSIQALIGPGQSPHTYEPSPQKIAALSKADIYLTIGLPFEQRLLAKSADIFNRVQIVDTRRGITFRHMETHHDEHDEHEGTLDPHFWLDPVMAKTMIRNMVPGDSDLWPLLRRNRVFEAINLRLDSLDAYIAAKLAPFKGQKLYVFHPSFGYFCDRYGLEQVAIETEGKEPSARQLAKLIEQAKADHVKVIIIQSQFSQKTARAIASEIGAEVISLDPLAYDYINNMKHMADTIADALSKR